jgi:hypothetical protein
MDRHELKTVCDCAATGALKGKRRSAPTGLLLRSRTLFLPRARRRPPTKDWRARRSLASKNEEPRRKQRGIFVGVEIYFTGGGHTYFVLLYNSYSQKKFNRGQAAGYEPPPSNQHTLP